MSSKAQQYLILLNSTQGAATEETIKAALVHPTIYKFGEFLDHDAVKKLVASSQAKKVLELFVYGSFQEFKENRNNYVLNAQELKKLKQLSLVKIASTNKVISYDFLKETLEISAEDLEPLILDCMWAGLLRGRLDQVDEVLITDYTLGQDVGQQEDFSAMKNKLQNWITHLTELCGSLNNEITAAERDYNDRATQKVVMEQTMEFKLNQLITANIKEEQHNRSQR